MQDPLLARQPTINPYRTAAKLVLDRMAWDLNPESWRSRAKLRAWRNRFAGEKAVILCNGPSLNRVDFDALKGVHTFGLNKINLLFERSTFRPSFIACVNQLVIEQNAAFFNTTDLPLFISSFGTGEVRSRANVAFVNPANLQKFAQDVSVCIFEGYTVTFVALQLAFHMGFKEVALVGADHSFNAAGPANATAVSGEKDENHFDPRYFSGGAKWQLPDLFQSEVAYTLARDMFAAHGRRVVNATDGGQLNVFERQPLQQFLAAS